jgi:hypothetical protein
MLCINRKDLCTKSYQFKFSDKDDYDEACKTVNIKNFKCLKLAKWALTCYSSSTRERLLSESGHS